MDFSLWCLAVQQRLISYELLFVGPSSRPGSMIIYEIDLFVWFDVARAAGVDSIFLKQAPVCNGI